MVSCGLEGGKPWICPSPSFTKWTMRGCHRASSTCRMCAALATSASRASAGNASVVARSAAMHSTRSLGEPSPAKTRFVRSRGASLFD